ncbi:hypothetical protein [Frankia sp. QA3]|uniref:hypothetical protein n=1 Tax=Frankia sp. QA3 TaxID=710111 RepID=UPI000269C2F9|nr:hypothetical protein [Frankia sp. QA3]EIV91180.1 hypothetical protein FraQA3DRAFT_0614 [Frankia sp. QA3]
MPRTRTPDRCEHVGDALRAGRDLDAIHAWGCALLYAAARGAAETPLPPVRHPLGFLCQPLHRRPPQGLCLHLWPPPPAQRPAPGGGIHAHSWSMTSIVLLGEVGNETIGVADDRPGTHQVLRVASRGDVDVLHPTGRTVRPYVAHRQRLRRGARYKLAAGVFHRTRLTAASATLVLGDHEPGSRDLVLGGLHERVRVVTRQPCGDDELRAAAGHVLRGRS